jgi:hypothetical protein
MEISTDVGFPAPQIVAGRQYVRAINTPDSTIRKLGCLQAPSEGSAFGVKVGFGGPLKRLQVKHPSQFCRIFNTTPHRVRGSGRIFGPLLGNSVGDRPIFGRPRRSEISPKESWNNTDNTAVTPPRQPFPAILHHALSTCRAARRS